MKEFKNNIDCTESGYRMKRDFVENYKFNERIRKWLAPPSPFLKIDINEKLNVLFNHSGENTVVLNIGSGNIKLKEKVINLDTYIFPGVDVVGDAHQLPFENESLDSIIIIAVLEHIRQPQLVMQEIYRVLRKGGYVYVDVPFMAHYHGYPNDFQRYTLSGLEELCSGFSKVDSGVVVGPSSALCEMLRIYATLFSNKFYVQKFLQGVIGWLTFPLKYLDLFMVKNKDAYIAAYANFVLAKKEN